MSFDGWLDARDGETPAGEWATPGAKRVEFGQQESRGLSNQPEGAALPAAAWLAGSPDRFTWFTADYDDHLSKAATADVLCPSRKIFRETHAIKYSWPSSVTAAAAAARR